MNSSDEYFYMDLRKQFSTRRYIYEGLGGQKHDKTLILHKSESHPDDTIILRLCKRLSARVSWSSCIRGKLFFATLLALLAVFCYFNLFSDYLPRPCKTFQSASRKLKSVANETVLTRSKNSFRDDFYTLLYPKISQSQYVSTFTKNVAMDMYWDGVSTTIFQKYSDAIVESPYTVIDQASPTTHPTSNTEDKAGKDVLIEQSMLVKVEMQRLDRWNKDRMPLLSRIINARKAITVN